MVKRKHSVEQIIGKLRETEVELAQGRSVAEVCRSLGVTEQTYSGISILSFPFTRKPMPATLSCQPQTALASLRW